MSLLNLPTELLFCILECLDTDHDINAFVRLNCFLYHSFVPHLYKCDKEQNSSSALLWAATCGEVRTAYKALDVQPSIDDIQRALSNAVENGNCEIADMLVKQGANVNSQGGFFGTLLQAASWAGNWQMMRFLINQGADVNAQGGYYNTALQATSWTGNEETMRLLLDEGADVGIEGGYFGNALQAASWGGNQGIVKLLVLRGANVNMEGGYYGNALQAASWKGHKHIVLLLLRLGANSDARGGRFGSPIQAAWRGYNSALLPLLGGQHIQVMFLLRCWRLYHTLMGTVM